MGACKTQTYSRCVGSTMELYEKSNVNFFLSASICTALRWSHAGAVIGVGHREGRADVTERISRQRWDLRDGVHRLHRAPSHNSNTHAGAETRDHAHRTLPVRACSLPPRLPNGNGRGETGYARPSSFSVDTVNPVEQGSCNRGQPHEEEAGWVGKSHVRILQHRLLPVHANDDLGIHLDLPADSRAHRRCEEQGGVRKCRRASVPILRCSKRPASVFLGGGMLHVVARRPAHASVGQEPWRKSWLCCILRVWIRQKGGSRNALVEHGHIRSVPACGWARSS